MTCTVLSSCDGRKAKFLLIFRFIVWWFRMRKMKSLGKGSFLRGLLRALGIDRDSTILLPPRAETQPSVSMIYSSHALKQTAWLEAEQAKAKAIIELQRKSTI